MTLAYKACPVVFRDPSMQQILACEHPSAGLQLVKGGIEPGEDPRAGGHDFKFFWHDVNLNADDKWRPQYRRALQTIRERTRALRWRG